MADQNPTCERRVVPVALPSEQVAFLRSELMSWLAGVRDDLETPDKLGDPGRSVREAATYERLLAALDRGEIVLPDEEARSAVVAAAAAQDETNKYAEVVAIHDAHQALIELLDPTSAAWEES